MSGYSPAAGGTGAPIDTNPSDYVPIGDTFALGTVGAAMDAGTQLQHAANLAQTGHAVNEFIPADYGIAAWSWDPALSNNGVAPNLAGTIQVVRVHLRVQKSISFIYLIVQTAGATLTANQCIARLYNANLTKIGTGNGTAGSNGVTASQDVAWTTTKTKEMALTGGPFVIGPGDILIAWTYQGTTGPKFQSLNTSGPNANMFDTGNTHGLSLTNSRFATADVGITTTMPDTLAALGQTNASSYFAGIG